MFDDSLTELCLAFLRLWDSRVECKDCQCANGIYFEYQGHNKETLETYLLRP